MIGHCFVEMTTFKFSAKPIRSSLAFSIIPMAHDNCYTNMDKSQMVE